ncbi:Sm-like ribonucleo protein [Schizopora paradoxa]|uniref:Small nuclear ribonucleoprotein E n=1 Tax=Schizopora paradoxa TaxID=27342 RepID=A0A0H2S7P2_9AGAM|nr:Sm-like ribonucleo protein [Schizopora paradoxa]
MSGRQSKVMVQPINVLFGHLQKGTTVLIWLYDNLDMRIEGIIEGFDEFMNITLKDAAEVYLNESKPREELGEILLKGDNITLVQPLKK